MATDVYHEYLEHVGPSDLLGYRWCPSNGKVWKIKCRSCNGRIERADKGWGWDDARRCPKCGAFIYFYNLETYQYDQDRICFCHRPDGYFWTRWLERVRWHVTKLRARDAKRLPDNVWHLNTDNLRCDITVEYATWPRDLQQDYWQKRTPATVAKWIYNQEKESCKSQADTSSPTPDQASPDDAKRAGSSSTSRSASSTTTTKGKSKRTRTKAAKKKSAKKSAKKKTGPSRRKYSSRSPKKGRSSRG